jgi:hypothetical protein
LGSPWDVAFGRLAVQHGLVAQEAVRVVYGQLPPGRTLKDELVARGLLAPDRAHALEAMLRTHASGRAPAQAADDSATLRRPAPAPRVDDDVTMVRSSASSDRLPAARPASGGATRLPEVGQVIAGRYELTGLLGKGGMGAVFKARDAQTGELFALKVLLPGADPDGNVLARFRREAEAVAKVDAHAGIVRVRALGEHQGLPYVVMDLVVGDDLHKLVKAGGPLDVARALRYTEAVARAVQHCHDKGVLHRDLKPANVLLRAHDDAPLVMDFGLALHGEGERLTKTGEVMGTPAFMSPEQADGNKAEIDHRTDVYALGGVLYELVKGRAPFEGGPMQILAQVFRELPEPIAVTRPDVPADLDVIVRKAMAKDKRLRYATARDLADDLGRLARGEPITARPPTAREELEWRARRGDVGAQLQLRKRGFGVIAAASAALLVGAFVALFLVWRGAQLPAALALVPAALREDGPLERGTATNLAVDALLVHAPPAEGDAARLEALTRLIASPRPGFERQAAALRADPAGALALRALVRRLAIQDGRALASEDEGATGGAEDHLLRALSLLRWKQSPTLEEVAAAPAPVEDPRARLALAAKDQGKVGGVARDVLADLERIDAEVQGKLRACGDDLARTVKRALTDPRVKVVDPYARGDFSTTPPELAAYASLAFVREKPTAVAAVIEALDKIVEEDDARAWFKERRRYDVIVEAVNAGLRPFITTPPSVRLDPRLTAVGERLLTTVGRRTWDAKADQGCLDSFSRLIGVTEECIGRLGDHFRLRTTDAVLLSFRSALEQGKRPPLSTVMLLPSLHYLPTARAGFEPMFRRAVEDREIDTYVKQHRTADSYLVWAELLCSIRDNDDREDVALIRTVREKYAAALGDHLDAATRARLDLGPPERLDVTLTPFFVPYALARVGLYTARLERRSGTLRRPVIEAALALLRELRLARDDRGPVEKRRITHTEMDCLAELVGLAELDAPWRAALEAQYEEAIAAEIEQGWEIARGMATGERREGYEEGSAGAADLRLDEDALEGVLQDALRELAHLYERTGRAPAAIDLLVTSLTRYRGLGALPFPYQLLRTLGRLRLQEGDLAAAGSIAREVLHEAELRPGADPKSRKKVTELRDDARGLLARVLVKQGDITGARALLDAARADGTPLDRGHWEHLLRELGDR